MAITFKTTGIEDTLAKAKLAAEQAQNFAQARTTINFGELLENNDGWSLVPTLVGKGYKGQPLTDKLNEVLSLGKDGGLTRAVVTKAIRAEAWRRQAEAEERNDTDALSKAKLVIETLGLHGPKTETADTASLVVKPSRRKKSVKKIQPGTGAVFGKVPASNQGAATQQRAAKPQQEVL